MDDVHAIILLAHEQEALDILRLPTGLNHVRRRVGTYVIDGGVEVGEFLERDYRHTVLLEFLLTECAIVFQPIGVRRSAYNDLASCP